MYGSLKWNCNFPSVLYELKSFFGNTGQSTHLRVSFPMLPEVRSPPACWTVRSHAVVFMDTSLAGLKHKERVQVEIQTNIKNKLVGLHSTACSFTLRALPLQSHLCSVTLSSWTMVMRRNRTRARTNVEMHCLMAVVLSPWIFLLSAQVYEAPICF